jgi:hypothetical protein
MWAPPKIGQRVKISTKFWDAFLNYKVNGRAPDWYDRCNRDGGWIVNLVTPAFPSCDQVILGFESPGGTAGKPPNFQVFLDTGALYVFEDGPPMFEVIGATWDAVNGCPLCGSRGTPMANKFYCTHSGCRNYEPGEIKRLARL